MNVRYLHPFAIEYRHSGTAIEPKEVAALALAPKLASMVLATVRNHLVVPAIDGALQRIWRRAVKEQKRADPATPIVMCEYPGADAAPSPEVWYYNPRAIGSGRPAPLVMAGAVASAVRRTLTETPFRKRREDGSSYYISGPESIINRNIVDTLQELPILAEGSPIPPTATDFAREVADVSNAAFGLVTGSKEFPAIVCALLKRDSEAA